MIVFMCLNFLVEYAIKISIAFICTYIHLQISIYTASFSNNLIQCVKMYKFIQINECEYCTLHHISKMFDVHVFMEHTCIQISIKRNSCLCIDVNLWIENYLFTLILTRPAVTLIISEIIEQTFLVKLKKIKRIVVWCLSKYIISEPANNFRNRFSWLKMEIEVFKSFSI